MELHDYLVIVRAYWRSIVAFVILGALLALAWSLAQPKVYASTATGFVTSGTTAADPSMANVNDVLSKSRVKSYVGLATDRQTAEFVIDDLNLTESPEELISNVTVEQRPDTVLLGITVNARTPESAQELANAWVKALSKSVREFEDPSGTGKAAMRLLPNQTAALPTAPTSPKIPLNVILGSLVGLALGLAYSITRHRLDRRLRTASQVEKDTGFAVVASVPALGSGDTTEPRQLVTDPQTTTERLAAESFRKLRTNLSFMDVNHPPRVIVVTSPSKGDGKSTIAASLALAIAHAGQPVFLLEGDLRRPRVAKMLKLDNSVGVSDVLAGRVPLSEALNVDAQEGQLRVLTSGTRVPNPSELLGSNAMRELLAELSQTGMVIVNAPPLLPVTDGAVLARIADGALVVVSTGKTVDTELTAALGVLERVSGRVLGIIMGRVSKRTTTPGTYHEYGYYDYESRDKKRSRKSSDTPESGKVGRRAAR